MSNEICHRDQHKINQMLEQIRVLSNVVDDLRREINNFKKISISVDDQNVFLECTNENTKTVDHVESSLLGKVKPCFKNTGASARTEETCRSTQNIQVSF